jgi:hypothetical protein
MFRPDTVTMVPVTFRFIGGPAVAVDDGLLRRAFSGQPLVPPVSAIPGIAKRTPR